MKRLNQAVLAIAPSATLVIASESKRLISEGVKICAFAAGEPDFDTPDCIKAACVDALNRGQTKYVPVAGLSELTVALSKKLLTENGCDYEPSQIVISNGGKHSLALVFQTLVSSGDEVIVPAPYWLSYPDMISVAGGVPVIVDTTVAESFKMTPEKLEAAITDRTVAVVINSPSNPTGVMYTPDELRALGDVAIKHDIMVVSDEIYEKMVYGPIPFVSMASFSPEHYEHTITVNGFSKTYSMTGWRLGYTAAPIRFIKPMCALQSHCASGPNTFAQWGAVAALTEAEADVAVMVNAFKLRLKRILELFAEIEGVVCAEPEGAFYVFPSIEAFGLDSLTFAQRLLVEQQVAVVPGVAFGNDSCVRFSYACSMANIEEGLARFKIFCDSLRTAK